jgi:hypothetical protein
MNPDMQQPPQGSSIVVDEHGVYRWAYEFNLFTNPTILFTVMKILLGLVVAGVVIMLAFMIPDLINGYADASDVAESLRSGFLFILFFAVLTVVGYAVYALMNGGKYCVVFTMDERGVEHRQLPRQFKKAQVLGGLNVLAGLAAGNLTQMGLGVLTATHNVTSSDFSVVRSIKGSRALRTIKVNEPLAKNQIYVDPGDYDFVLNYIASRCPNAIVKG